MINREEFKKEVVEALELKFPESRIETHVVDKVNVARECINIVAPGSNISPCLYVDSLYSTYKDSEDFDFLINDIVDKINDSKDALPLKDYSSIDFSKVADKVVFSLINREQNKENLANWAHRDFLDLSIIYRWIISLDSDNSCSSIINNGMLQSMGITEEELFLHAMKNTCELLPVDVKPMSEMLESMFMDDSLELATPIPIIPPEQDMHVLTNVTRTNGAAVMLYEDELFKLANKLNSNFYILPSSIHELIAVSEGYMNLNALTEMVREVNMNEVSLEERLSNQVYYYDRDERKVTLATNTDASLDYAN